MTDPDIPRREITTENVTAVAGSAPPKSFARRHWGKLLLLVLLGVPLLVLVIWSYVALGFTYSSGNKVGYVQKLSKQGWLCKTWEGELQISATPGSAPVIFQFTVRDDSVARAMEGALSGRVELHYEEHPGVPLRCFGETANFVVGVRRAGS